MKGKEDVPPKSADTGKIVQLMSGDAYAVSLSVASMYLVYA